MNIITDTNKLDLIVFGATGFNGKQVREYLAKNYGTDENIHWGIADRDRDKLNALKAESGAVLGSSSAQKTQVSFYRYYR
ncbi:MAG: hypothetical protein P8169_13840 [Chloroflexota bacterium]|jgi:short subunit dehydrogenase-like uncharacterized protein